MDHASPWWLQLLDLLWCPYQLTPNQRLNNVNSNCSAAHHDCNDLEPKTVSWNLPEINTTSSPNLNSLSPIVVTSMVDEPLALCVGPSSPGSMCRGRGQIFIPYGRPPDEEEANQAQHSHCINLKVQESTKKQVQQANQPCTKLQAKLTDKWFSSKPYNEDCGHNSGGLRKCTDNEKRVQCLA